MIANELMDRFLLHHPQAQPIVQWATGDASYRRR